MGETTDAKENDASGRSASWRREKVMVLSKGERDDVVKKRDR